MSNGRDCVRGEGRLPDFLIVGAKRAGTTALTRYLDAHPDVFMAKPKELHFFDVDHRRGLDWYRERFAGAGALRTGEATPVYMYDPGTIARMRESVPDVRLIAVLRNPVDRAYSHYWMRRAKGLEPLRFEDAILAERQRLLAGESGAHIGYVDLGRYVGQLRALCDVYPREALLVLIFEEMVADIAGSYRSICEFIGVDPNVAPAVVGRQVNKFATFRSIRVRNISLRLQRRGRTQLSRRTGRLVAGLNVRRRAAYPALDRGIRAELNDRFALDNAALADWLGCDLSHWAGSEVRP
jgi:hypothetical protein